MEQGRSAGEPCLPKGRAPSGYEKRYNYAFQIKDREEFIKLLTTDMPEAPDHFSRCSEINRKGPTLTRDLPHLIPYDPPSFYQKVKEMNTIVLDIRSYEAFGGQPVPGAYHIDFGGNFSTFAGWILPPETEILLVSENASQAEEAVIQLRRVGLDRTIGFLDGGMYEWAKAGLITQHVCQLSATELKRRMTEGPPMILIDVRAKREFMIGHLEGSINIPVSDLRKRYQELNSSASVAVVCNSGHRSSLGASLLKRHGFKDVSNLAGGMMGYHAAGLGPECPVCIAPHGPQQTQ